MGPRKNRGPVFIAAAAVVICTPGCTSQQVHRWKTQAQGAHAVGYTALLELNPTSHRFHGTIQIDVSGAGGARCIALDARALTFRSAKMHVGKTTSSLDSFVDNDQVRLCAAKSLPNEPFQLQLDYDGAIAQQGSFGLFRQDDDGKAFLFTHFEPLGARQVFPCFDRPAEKAPWQITLDVPASLTGVSNSPLESATVHGDAQRLRFSITDPIPTYSVAFAVGPFVIQNGGHIGSVPLRALTTRRSDESQVLDVHRELLPRLASYVGKPYPYAKLDIVVVPSTYRWAGMENPGLIAYGRNGIHPTGLTPEHALRSMSGLVAHELAHMWFGDLVTMREWRDIWLSEGLAEWVRIEVMRQWQPTWDLDLELAASRVAVMSQDRDGAPAVRHSPTVNPDDVFDATTYRKGPSIVQMIAGYVGDRRFQEILRAYIHTLAGSTSDVDDLLALIRKKSGADEARAASGSLERPGVPTLRAHLECSTTAHASFRLEQLKPISAPEGVMACIRYGGANVGRQCAIVGARPLLLTATTPGCPKWVEANDRASGYYRVDYNDDDFANVVQAWAELSQAERLQAFSDAEASVDRGTLSIEAFVRAIPKIMLGASEQLRFRVAHALAGYRALLSSDSDQIRYEHLINILFGDDARRLRFSSSVDGTDVDVKDRVWIVALVAIDGRDAALGSEAVKRTTDWLDGREALPASTKELIVLSAARHADAAFLSLVRRRLGSARDDDRELLLDILGGLRDPKFAATALSLCGAELNADECMRVMQDLGTDPRTAFAAYTFMKSAFINPPPWLHTVRIENAFARLGTLCAQTELADARSSLSSLAPAGTDAARVFNEKLEEGKQCVERRAKLGWRLATVLAGLDAKETP